MKTKVTESKDKLTYSLSFQGMTKGELLSLKNALTMWSESSPVAQDVLYSLDEALRPLNIRF